MTCEDGVFKESFPVPMVSGSSYNNSFIMIMDLPIETSIVIPFHNEEENVERVINEILQLYPKAEIIAIDDGSNDATWDIICKFKNIRRLRFLSNRGQSAAMLAGLHSASKPICVLMDGDGQNDPADIFEMVNLLKNNDAVFGYRKVRKDTTSRRLASKYANRIRRMIIHDGITDTGCSLKAFRKELIHFFPPINGVHRFMGAFLVANNINIVEIPVNHRARVYGDSKYDNFHRALRGIYDLIGVSWYVKRMVNINIDCDE